ncbi:hypothetical protein [Streptomyces avidinii]
MQSLGSLLLNHATAADLYPVAPPSVLERLERYRADPPRVRPQRAPDNQRGDLHSYFAPGDAAATAVAVAAAVRILRAGRPGGRRWPPPAPCTLHPANVVALGGAISPVLEAAVRCSRENLLMPVARLRHRTAVHSTRPPAGQDARARMLPTALWPEWALRLSPRHPSGRPAARRADELLSVACLLAGNTAPIQAATRLMGTTVTSHNVSTLLADVTRRSECADVLHVLILLADHLDAHGSPIDYARRRTLFTARPRFLDPRVWRELQRRLRSNSGADAMHAQRWIFHGLTGSPPHLAHPDIASATVEQRRHYQRFSWRILPAEAELLHHTAQGVLDEHGIDEPVQWSPKLPARVLRGLVLPGPDPDSIHAAQLHQAVPGGDFSIAQLARRLKTTSAHVAYLLARDPVDWSPPRFQRTQHTATRVRQWRTWYEQDRQALQAIADQERTSLATIRLALLRDGTQLRPPGSYPGRPRRR